MQPRGTKCQIRTTSCELLVEDRAKPLELVKPVELAQTVMLSPAWKRAPNLDNRALLAVANSPLFNQKAMFAVDSPYFVLTKILH
jgi:hypothetical protein